MIEYVLIGVTSWGIGVAMGVVASVHYILTHPQELMDKVGEEFA